MNVPRFRYKILDKLIPELLIDPWQRKYNLWFKNLHNHWFKALDIIKLDPCEIILKFQET